MNLFNQLFNTKGHHKKVKVPNGWGRQNYNGKAKEAVFKEPIDLNNIKAKRGWIRAFMAHKIEGLHLKKRWFNPYYSLKYKPLDG